MIEQNAIVAKVESSIVWVDSRQSRTCGGCHQQDACATSLLDKLIAKRLIEVESDLELNPGDAVVIGIEEHSLISASLLQYFFPLLLMLAAAAILDGTLNPAQPYRDLTIAGSALLALAASLKLISRWQRGFLFSYVGRPVVLRKL